MFGKKALPYGRASDTLSAQFRQTLCRQHQRLVLLAETEPHLLRVQGGIAVKTRAGNAGHADLADQMPGEFNVIPETEGANVGHDVISAVGRKSSKTCPLKLRQKQVAAGPVINLELIVVRRRKGEGVSARGLQRRGGADS